MLNKRKIPTHITAAETRGLDDGNGIELRYKHHVEDVVDAEAGHDE
ncbi:MAG: hypothetical protein IPN38_19090 [Flavobacteriales bacterium]|nr:hypothetical protein [Flavobacteriales bacterium]